MNNSELSNIKVFTINKKTVHLTLRKPLHHQSFEDAHRLSGGLPGLPSLWYASFTTFLCRLSSVWTEWYMKIQVPPSFTLNTKAQTNLNTSMLTPII